MASIFGRLADIIKANVDRRADDREDPAEAVDEYLGKLVENLAEVREKTQAVIEEERRAADAVEKNRQDVRHYEDLAKAALGTGNEADARTFLQRKVELASQGQSLQDAYRTVHETADKMRRLHDGLVEQINQINGRKRAALSRSDAAEARIQVAETAGGGSSKNEADILEALSSLEKQAAHLEGRAEAYGER